MDEFEFPCPKCGESLISDQETAGSEAVCPYCDKLIMMPAAPPQEANLAPPRSEIPPTDPERASSSQIPDRRTSKSEIAKLAAVAHGAQIEDFSKIETKGMVSFSCPGCSRLIWIRQKDAGMIVACGGCSQDVLCPSPGKAAQLVNPRGSGQAAMPKAVLPTRRSEDHLPLEEFPVDEQATQGTHRRRTLLPSGPRRNRQGSGSPGAKAEQAEQPRKSVVKPIPKDRDVEISPTELKRYRAGTRGRRSGEEPSRKAELPPPRIAGAGTGTALPPSRHAGGGSVGASSKDARNAAHRLSPELRPKLATMEELEGRSESDHWGQDHAERPHGMRRLLIGAAILGLPALAAAAFLAFQGAGADPDGTEPVGTREATEKLSEYKETSAVLRNFLNAGTIEDRLKWVRDAGRVEPLMGIHYVRQEKSDYVPEIEQITWSTSATIGTRKFTKLTVRFNDDSLRAAVFEITGNGPKLDWESFVFFADPVMSEFVRNRSPDPATFRVFCSQADYYNHMYEDESKYVCFSVSEAPDGVAACFAYTDIESEVAGELAELFRLERERQERRGSVEGGELAIKVTMTLRFETREDKISDSQAWIDEVVAGSWLVP